MPSLLWSDDFNRLRVIAKDSIGSPAPIHRDVEQSGLAAQSSTTQLPTDGKVLRSSFPGPLPYRSPFLFIPPSPYVHLWSDGGAI